MEKVFITIIHNKYNHLLNHQIILLVVTESNGSLQVVMHFKKKFWAPKVHGARVFTSLALMSEDENLVHMFYDVSLLLEY